MLIRPTALILEQKFYSNLRVVARLDRLISMNQEPMTRSLQLPYWAYVTAFLQTDLFLDYLFRKKQRQFRLVDPMTSA